MIISWNITKRCNLFCDHCYRESEDKNYKDELSLEEGLRLIDGIKKAGFKILVLSGGEPLLREELYDFARHASDIGLIPVIGTNGTLIDEEKARMLKESGIRAAAVSMDYLDEERHDMFRGKEGSLSLAKRGIKNLLDAGIRVQINTTITKNNKDELMDLIDFAQANGASSHHPFFLVETGRGKDMKGFGLEGEEYMDLISDIMEKQKDVDIELKPTCAPQFMAVAKEKGMKMRFTRGCIAGIGYCCVLPNGKVHICPYLQIEAGDVRQEDFYTIWKESPVFLELRDYSNYKGACKSCKNIDICGGCRARAFSKTGDHMNSDPMCRLCYKPKDE